MNYLYWTKSPFHPVSESRGGSTSITNGGASLLYTNFFAIVLNVPPKNVKTSHALTLGSFLMSVVKDVALYCSTDIKVPEDDPLLVGFTGPGLEGSPLPSILTSQGHIRFS